MEGPYFFVLPERHRPLVIATFLVFVLLGGHNSNVNTVVLLLLIEGCHDISSFRLVL